MVWQPLNLTQVCPADSQVTACSPFGYVYLNLLVQLFGDSRDRRIQEKLRRRHEDDGIVETIDREEYDFIVVGAGSAGCVVANRLSANKKWKVLLLEAGDEQPDVTLVPALCNSLFGSNIDWNYSTEPDGKSCLSRPGGRCTWPRGKAMGGSSSINSMVYIRGNRLDYDGWAALGNEGWSYKDVLPYFKKSENNQNIETLNRKYHGVDGEMSISSYPYIDKSSPLLLEAYKQMGLPRLDQNAERQLGANRAQSFSKGGERMSTNSAFIQPIRYKRKNLIVKVQSEVTEILIDDNNSAYGVKYVKDGNEYIACAKKEVIVSAGSINSPKLLMLSGIGPEKHLLSLNISVRQDLAVGENLQDHVGFDGLVIALNESSTLFDSQIVLQEVINYRQMKSKDGPLACNGLLNIVAFLKSNPSLPAPDVQIQHIARLSNFIDPQTNIVDAIFPTSFYDMVSPIIMNLVPKSSGHLLLNVSNPHGPPMIYANYFGDPSDLIPIVAGARFFLSLENTEAFKSVGARFLRRRMPPCRGYKWGTDEYIVCLVRHYSFTVYHPIGTCKMGPKSDNTAVVDSKLRVYGVSCLRVIDASIMPFHVRGNTNAPTIKIFGHLAGLHGDTDPTAEALR